MTAQQDYVRECFLQTKPHLNDELLKAVGPFLVHRHLVQYCRQLKAEHEHQFIRNRQEPYFIDEVTVPDVKEIWNRHFDFIQQLGQLTENQIAAHIHSFMEQTPFDEFLTILGQRFTPASLRTAEALPPEREPLIQAAFAPHNNSMSIALRAWEKHVGRNGNTFWGTVSGTVDERTARVKQLIEKLMNRHTWWNVFVHYKHGKVFEIREPGGHGIRWMMEPFQLIGFLEPFDNC